MNIKSSSHGKYSMASQTSVWHDTINILKKQQHQDHGYKCNVAVLNENTMYNKRGQEDLYTILNTKFRVRLQRSSVRANQDTIVFLFVAGGEAPLLGQVRNIHYSNIIPLHPLSSISQGNVK